MGSSPAARPLPRVSPSTIAPAASVGPSRPSVPAAAILYRTIRAVAPAANVQVHIPHRIDDGYGLNNEGIIELADAGVVDEIRMLVEQSGEGGSLRHGDARLLEGVFEFSEKTAEEVMTPRTDIAALEADAEMPEAADMIASSGRSRYPVYTDTLDEIIGVVHTKDILRALRDQPGTTVRQVMRQPLFVPGTREVEDVLADMKRLKTHLAVVLDEYGGTAGLVTMEDLLEEIVGEILDEHDAVEALPITPSDGTMTLDASLPLTEFNSRFDADLDDTDYTTLGGFLFGQLGRLPRQGDRIKVGELHFEILEMDGRRVDRVKVLAAEPGAG